MNLIDEESGSIGIFSPLSQELRFDGAHSNNKK
jgi:hypothetical protein